MSISASIQSQPITASVGASGAITASVGSSVVSASASGGIGPQGPAGSDGGSLDGLADVSASSAQPGDVLQYGVGNQWQNNPILDGGNW